MLPITLLITSPTLIFKQHPSFWWAIPRLQPYFSFRKQLWAIIDRSPTSQLFLTKPTLFPDVYFPITVSSCRIALAVQHCSPLSLSDTPAAQKKNNFYRFWPAPPYCHTYMAPCATPLPIAPSPLPTLNPNTSAFARDPSSFLAASISANLVWALRYADSYG